jgi:prepilin-type processing-associated H-X9-DG protein
MGTAVLLYMQDYDERLFFRSSTNPNVTRIQTATSGNALKWWNMILPYLKNTNVFKCPSDPGSTPSPDINGNNTILRSYVASASAESLTLAQISKPSETLVIGEKWDKDARGKVVTETWLEAFDGDMSPDPDKPQQMVKFASRHQGGMNGTFFDGHAKWVTPGAIWQSRDLTGCRLVHTYPTPRMCDYTFAGCLSTSSANYCNTPAFFPYPND